MHRAEQRDRSDGGIVQALKRRMKGKRAWARPVDIPHERVAQIRRIDSEVDSPVDRGSLVERAASRETADQVGDRGRREAERRASLLERGAVVPGQGQESEHMPALGAERTRIPADYLAKQRIAGRDMPQVFRERRGCEGHGATDAASSLVEESGLKARPGLRSPSPR